jgi:hypothetical protein
MVEAGLIAYDSSIDRLSEMLDMEKETLDTYTYLFFDKSMLRDKVDLVEYLGNLAKEGRKAEFVAKTQAIRHGMYTVYEQFNLGKHVRPIKDILDTYVSVADSMVRQGVGLSVSSPEAREIKDWMKLMGGLITSKHKQMEMDPDNDTSLDFADIIMKPNKEVKDIKLIEHELVM